MKNLKVLIIEDDPHITELITLYLEKIQLNVCHAFDGIDGLDKFYEELPDLVLLDIMLPKMDGWEISKEIRKDYDTPIIMLTGKGESYDKLKGFNLGADDYVVKPFDPKELIARIKAVLRRSNPGFDSQEIISLPELTIDLRQYKVIAFDQEIILPPKEMDLLYFLVTHANQVFTRQQLLDKIWGFDYNGDFRTVDVHIKRIREKLGDDNIYWNLKTIRGIGYKFEVSN